MEGVPVELNVATIFEAIMALLPIPVTTTLPLLFSINLTDSTKSEFIERFNPDILLASISMEDSATSDIFFSEINFFYFVVLNKDFFIYLYKLILQKIIIKISKNY
jgi:hypothetical protein